MEQDVERRRRIASAEKLAYRAEQKLMLPFRKQIGTLQDKVAFVTALAASSRSPGPEKTADDLRALLAAVDVAIEQIDASVSGPGQGPAENCRKALGVLKERIQTLSN